MLVPHPAHKFAGVELARSAAQSSTAFGTNPQTHMLAYQTRGWHRAAAAFEQDLNDHKVE
jgi:hypothetical protein